MQVVLSGDGWRVGFERMADGSLFHVLEIGHGRVAESAMLGRIEAGGVDEPVRVSHVERDGSRILVLTAHESVQAIHVHVDGIWKVVRLSPALPEYGLRVGVVEVDASTRSLRVRSEPGGHEVPGFVPPDLPDHSDYGWMPLRN